MGFTVASTISPKAAAKLIISGEIDLSDNWSYETAEEVLDALLELPISDILAIIDTNQYGQVADVKCIPQFGRLETITKVPSYFANNYQLTVDYPQLGFYLKQDVEASLNANTKFGENHGKVAALCGIVLCKEKRFTPSCLTTAFAQYSTDQQMELLTKLLFRIPIIQTILKEAGEGLYNGYEPMLLLQASTMLRRSYSLRAILKQFHKYSDENLIFRLDNIIWENSEIQRCDDAEI